MSYSPKMGPARFLEGSGRDLRLAARMLRKSPAFTLVVVLTLALGIGASAAIFSAVDGVLLRPLPYGQPERLVAIQETLLPQLPEFAVSPHHYFEWKKQATSFEGLAAMHEGSYNLTGLGEPTRVSAGRLTANILSTLGVGPRRDRAGTPGSSRSAER
jgi:hypothetical protein